MKSSTPTTPLSDGVDPSATPNASTAMDVPQTLVSHAFPQTSPTAVPVGPMCTTNPNIQFPGQMHGRVQGEKPIPARVLAVVVNNPLNESKPPPPPPLPGPTYGTQHLPGGAQSLHNIGGPMLPQSYQMGVSVPIRALVGPPPPPPLPRNLDCHICGYKAPYPSKLRVHIDHHLKNRRFRCQKCPKAYVTKSELRRHMKRLNHSDVPIAGYNRRNRRTFDARAAGWTCAVCDSDRVVAPGGRGSKLPNVLSGDLHPRRIVVDGESKSVCNACYVHYHRYKTLRPKPVATTRSTPNQRKPARVTEEMKAREKVLKDLHADKGWLFKCKCARRCVALFLTKAADDDDSEHAEEWAVDEAKFQQIVETHRIAELLSKEKYVNVDSQGKAQRPGPGGGQRKSPTFTAHVLNSRAVYADLCEIAKQHILVYSNGFLHYKPVNGVPRVEIKRREYKIAAENLASYQCCRRKCLEGIRNEYVIKKRQEYESASQEGRNRLVQLVIEGDGRGPYRCVKSIKALLGCGEHVISAAFRTVMHDKVAEKERPTEITEGRVEPHRNSGRSPANRTPPEVEEKFKDHLFNSTIPHPRDPQIRILKRSCDSNKKLRKSFNEAHNFEISESTLRNVQKRVMAQNGIKRVERPEGIEYNLTRLAEINPFWQFPKHDMESMAISNAQMMSRQHYGSILHPPLVGPMPVPDQGENSSNPAPTRSPAKSSDSPKVKRQKTEGQFGDGTSSGASQSDESENEDPEGMDTSDDQSAPPPPPPGAPPQEQVMQERMMIHPPPPPGMFGPPPPGVFGPSLPFHAHYVQFHSPHFFPPMGTIPGMPQMAPHYRHPHYSMQPPGQHHRQPHPEEVINPAVGSGHQEQMEHEQHAPEEPAPPAPPAPPGSPAVTKSDPEEPESPEPASSPMTVVHAASSSDGHVGKNEESD